MHHIAAISDLVLLDILHKIQRRICKVIGLDLTWHLGFRHSLTATVISFPLCLLHYTVIVRGAGEAFLFGAPTT